MFQGDSGCGSAPWGTALLLFIYSFTNKVCNTVLLKFNAKFMELEPLFRCKLSRRDRQTEFITNK